MSSGSSNKPVALSGFEGFVDVNGVQLYCRIVGSGTPLVILHGGPGLSHDDQATHFERLLADDFQLISYDQRGSGRSTGASDPTRLTMQTFVEDVEGLRKALGLGQIHLAGHSFGGLLGMHYATRYSSHLRSLILMDTEAASYAIRTPYMGRIIDQRLTDREKMALEELEDSECFKSDPDAVFAHLKILTLAFFHDRDMAGRLCLEADEEARKNFLITNRAIRKDLGEYDIHDKLPSIACPTLIVHADSSPLSPEGAEEIHKRIPCSRLVVLKDCGHFLYIERPRELATAIRQFVQS